MGRSCPPDQVSGFAALTRGKSVIEIERDRHDHSAGMMKLRGRLLLRVAAAAYAVGRGARALGASAHFPVVYVIAIGA